MHLNKRLTCYRLRQSWFLVAAALLLNLSIAAVAPGSVEQLNRDWGGHWRMEQAMFMFSGFNNEESWHNAAVPEPKDFPVLKSAWLKRYRADREQAIKGNPVTDFTGDCIPYGFPLMVFFGGQYQFTADGYLNFFTHDYFYRHIALNKTSHATKLPLGYDGDSIAHWQGDTLVVDTIGMRTDTLVELGLTHSAQLHIIERLRKTGDDTMEVQYTFIDPVAFKQPWIVSKTFTRDDRTMHADLDDEPCQVNRNARDKNGDVLFLNGDGKDINNFAK